MLSNISWEAFLVITALIIACYYLVIGAIFYRQEISVLLKRYPAPLHDRTHNPLTASVTPVTGIMGVAGEHAETLHTFFAPVQTNAIGEKTKAAAESAEIHRAAYADIRQGLQTLFRAIAGKENGPDEFKTILPAFLEQYPEIAESSYRAKVNDYILEQCLSRFSFEITEDEINDLW